MQYSALGIVEERKARGASATWTFPGRGETNHAHIIGIQHGV